MSSPATHTSPPDRVQTCLEGSARHIRFDNPGGHNALSVGMWAAVAPLLRQAASDERVRLVVFSSAARGNGQDKETS